MNNTRKKKGGNKEHKSRGEDNKNKIRETKEMIIQFDFITIFPIEVWLEVVRCIPVVAVRVVIPVVLRAAVVPVVLPVVIPVVIPVVRDFVVIAFVTLDVVIREVLSI